MSERDVHAQYPRGTSTRCSCALEVEAPERGLNKPPSQYCRNSGDEDTTGTLMDSGANAEESRVADRLDFWALGHGGIVAFPSRDSRCHIYHSSKPHSQSGGYRWERQSRD
jgi:hypothetical protein